MSIKEMIELHSNFKRLRGSYIDLLSNVDILLGELELKIQTAREKGDEE